MFQTNIGQQEWVKQHKTALHLNAKYLIALQNGPQNPAKILACRKQHTMPG